MSHSSGYPPTAIADLHLEGPNPLRMTDLRPIRMYWLLPMLVVAISLRQLHDFLSYLETRTVKVLIEKYDDRKLHSASISPVQTFSIFILPSRIGCNRLSLPAALCRKFVASPLGVAVPIDGIVL